MNRPAEKPECRIEALAVSRGIGIGPIAILAERRRRLSRVEISAADVETELVRLHQAAESAARKLARISQLGVTNGEKPGAGIFDVQLLMLAPNSLPEKVGAYIKNEHVNAEWALKRVAEDYLEKQGSSGDQRFREKSLDIEDAVERLMAEMVNSAFKVPAEYRGAVIAARELRPSMIVELARAKPAALITERGGWTSHTSILARELGLPMASGIKNIARMFASGDLVIVDGFRGEVVLNPADSTVEYFSGISRETPANRASAVHGGSPVETLDGVAITIQANVDLPETYRFARTLGARGIGLWRSESLVRDLSWIPSEDEQTAAYLAMAQAAGSDGVRIRTFDIGRQHFEGEILNEANPSLGLRSIRLSLTDTDGFRRQLRAILRASVDARVDIVLPMVSGVSDIERSREILDTARKDLKEAGIPFGEPRLGAMIEVPSAVLTARQIAQRADFLCLGTNDLVQYLLAADRDNDSVADWYQTLHPGVIRAIGEVLAAANSASIPAAVCGEMAGSPFYVPVLIGLGARELSMNVTSITQVRRLIGGINAGDAARLVESVRSSETVEETESLLRKYYLENWGALFPPGLLEVKHR
ncbi:MAG TPA: phosphoenolpyruvate--protein phosphotransferase [Pyrinomonadaceae bacterium]|nr:phosphoenolpyruvate--protein phosphotransferase [Pyrinomonadaceae bacterium]